MGNDNLRLELISFEEKHMVREMLQDYLNGLSELPNTGVVPGEIDTYVQQYLDDYWQHEDRFPYNLMSGEDIVGFAFVRVKQNTWHMGEYYVKKEYRKTGLGMQFARKILKIHPGFWNISYNVDNKSGSRLWNKLAKEFAVSGIQAEDEGKGYICLKFSVIG